MNGTYTPNLTITLFQIQQVFAHTFVRLIAHQLQLLSHTDFTCSELFCFLEMRKNNYVNHRDTRTARDRLGQFNCFL